MPIAEEQISILIPTYRQPVMVQRAVESALASGCGEVIVSDDRSGDQTLDVLRRFGDPRLRVVEQPTNLGLWRNHLACLALATRPWVKFLQHDDRILPGGLAAMAAEATPQTAVVGATPLFEDLESGQMLREFELERPLRFTSDQYMRRLLTVGNELGVPSATLFRADILERTTQAWTDDLSADLVANVIAASRGEVVLLPPGAITIGRHAMQDGRTQGLKRAHRRLLNSVRFLAAWPDPRVRRFAAVFGCAESIAAGMLATRGLLRAKLWPLRALADVAKVVGISAAAGGPCHPQAVWRNLKWKLGRRKGRDIGLGAGC